MLKKKIVLIGLLLAAATIFSGFGVSEAAEGGDTLPKWVLIHDVHYVMDGEDLDQITKAYMVKNTYGPRDFKEFREGIIELNGLHETKELHFGQELKINYWVKPEEVLR